MKARDSIWAIRLQCFIKGFPLTHLFVKIMLFLNIVTGHVWSMISFIHLIIENQFFTDSIETSRFMLNLLVIQLFAVKFFKHQTYLKYWHNFSRTGRMLLPELFFLIYRFISLLLWYMSYKQLFLVNIPKQIYFLFTFKFHFQLQFSSVIWFFKQCFIITCSKPHLCCSS